jgi:hypothetical protein
MHTQPPLEDINAIVNRFQAWAGAQIPAQAMHGLRELTYEEALRGKSRRAGVKKTAAISEKAAPALPAKAKSPSKVKAANQSKRVVSPRKSKPNKAAVPSTVEPDFRQVLADTVALVPAVPSQLLASERRATALSLRISSAEHELFKRRAAEANVSISAYLRQCAIEVEGLRLQAKQLTVAKEAPMIQAPYRNGIFGSLTHFMRRITGARSTGLQLRA